jgi:hypothetical protein
MYSLLIDYYKFNGHFPSRVIVYVKVERSTSQVFSQMTTEVRGWNNAINRINREMKTGINQKLPTGHPEIHPNVTIITCIRSDSVRVNFDGEGVCVVDQVMTEPKGMNFYLQASNHKSAVHYRVVQDQNSFTLAELETYTREMCNAGSVIPRFVSYAKKLVQRCKSYIDLEVNVAKTLEPDSHAIAEYLNQKLFEETAIVSQLNSNGRMSYL